MYICRYSGMVNGAMLSTRSNTGFIPKKTSMKCFKSFVATYGGFTFKIEEDVPDVFFCLYVFKNGKCIRDDQQYTIQACKEVALEMYGVPMDAWREKVKGDD